MLARGPPGLLVLMSLMGGRQLAHAALEKVLGKGHLELEVSPNQTHEQTLCCLQHGIGQMRAHARLLGYFRAALYAGIKS